ncbi:MAG: FAD-dependent thymidylate synthase [Anaerolineales bacterium]
MIGEAGFKSAYEAAMESASKMYEKLHHVQSRRCAIRCPNGFNRRVLAQFNLREAFAFCQLRSAANAHFSIRRVAQKIYPKRWRGSPSAVDEIHETARRDVAGVEDGFFAANKNSEFSKNSEFFVILYQHNLFLRIADGIPRPQWSSQHLRQTDTPIARGS